MKKYCVDFLGEYEQFFFFRRYAKKAAKAIARHEHKTVTIMRWNKKQLKWEKYKIIWED